MQRFFYFTAVLFIAHLYTTPVSAQSAGDIIITEFMANPVALSDAQGEWFEIYNTTNTTIDLDSTVIKDLDNDVDTIFGALQICAGCYLVLGRSSMIGAPVDYVYSGIILSNSMDEIVLLAPNQTAYDSLVYNDSAWPLAAGVSMELDTLTFSAFSNDFPSNWCPAVNSYNGDLGTPGTVNDCSIGNCDATVDRDDDGYTCDLDCNDCDPHTYPGAPELCDGIDNNCDLDIPASEADSDGDLLPDCDDICPNDPDNDVDGDGVCGDTDNCPLVFNPVQSDTDGDTNGDLCDTDFVDTNRVGIGTADPATALHIHDGKFFLDDTTASLILTSPDGHCWLLGVNNTGDLATALIDCPQ